MLLAMADPKEWGPTFWKIIHIISEQLGKNTNTIMQKDEMIYYKAFQRKVYYILPCKICREHYTIHLENYPLTDEILKNKDNLLKWTIDLHNAVNEQLRYPILSYDDALNTLNTEINEIDKINENKYEPSYLLYFFILVIIIILIIYLKNNFTNIINGRIKKRF